MKKSVKRAVAGISAALSGLVLAAALGINVYIPKYIEGKLNEPEVIRQVEKAFHENAIIEVDRQLDIEISGFKAELLKVLTLAGSRDKATRKRQAINAAKTFIRRDFMAEKFSVVILEKPIIRTQLTKYLFGVKWNDELIVQFRIDENRNPVDTETLENTRFFREMKEFIEQNAGGF